MTKQRALLAPDDLSVGMHVTVHHGMGVTCTHTIPGGIVVQREAEIAGHYKGVPFAIIGVQFPYVLAAVEPSGEPEIFDLRLVSFMRVDAAYVNAYKAFMGKQPTPVNPQESTDQQGGSDGGVPVEA